MFHFPGCPPLRLCIHLRVTRHYPSRVPPFGNPRINAYLRLPLAYRSLSRPSSAISAMASTLRSCSLDLASSRRSPPPKTIRSGSRQDCFRVLVSSLCSFQGASSVAPALWAVATTRVEHLRFRQPPVGLTASLRNGFVSDREVSVLSDPSKRYRKVSLTQSNSLVSFAG